MLQELRNILSMIGKGHNAKPIAVLLPDGQVVYLDLTDVTIQGDRILFGSKE